MDLAGLQTKLGKLYNYFSQLMVVVRYLKDLLSCCLACGPLHSPPRSWRRPTRPPWPSPCRAAPLGEPSCTPCVQLQDRNNENKLFGWKTFFEKLWQIFQFLGREYLGQITWKGNKLSWIAGHLKHSSRQVEWNIQDNQESLIWGLQTCWIIEPSWYLKRIFA